MADSHDELFIKAEVESLTQVIAFMDEILEKNECSMPVQIQLDVALEEMFVNVAHYAYVPGPGDVRIDVDYIEADESVVITLIDSGVEFNPLAAAEPDVTLSADERKIGGLGIFMVKKTMDQVSYVREAGQNIFKMKKKIK